MKLAGLGVVSLLLQGLHFHTKSRIRDRGFVLLRQVQHALLLEPCASVPLTQGLELRPVCIMDTFIACILAYNACTREYRPVHAMNVCMLHACLQPCRHAYMSV